MVEGVVCGSRRARYVRSSCQRSVQNRRLAFSRQYRLIEWHSNLILDRGLLLLGLILLLLGRHLGGFL